MVWLDTKDLSVFHDSFYTIFFDKSLVQRPRRISLSESLYQWFNEISWIYVKLVDTCITQMNLVMMSIRIVLKQFIVLIFIKSNINKFIKSNINKPFYFTYIIYSILNYIKLFNLLLLDKENFSFLNEPLYLVIRYIYVHLL